MVVGSKKRPEPVSPTRPTAKDMGRAAAEWKRMALIAAGFLIILGCACAWDLVRTRRTLGYFQIDVVFLAIVCCDAFLMTVSTILWLVHRRSARTKTPR